MATRKSATKPRKLTDAHVEALREFNTLGSFPDSIVKGLHVFIGTHKTIWRFQRRRRVKGQRSTAFKTLGEWPMMDAETARKEAEIAAGMVANGSAALNRRNALKFDRAFAAYLEHLKAKAEKKGKPPRWHDNVKKLGDKIILPKFADWTLIELANSPDEVSDWHARVTKNNGPVSANHCARVVRATYKRAARRDISLPGRMPTSAVEFNDERPSQKALDFKEFPAWLKAWRAIDSGIRKAYHLTGLLVGPRPGELARLRWSDFNDNNRNLVIGKAKAGQDIVIPVSELIAAVLQMARTDAEALGYDVRSDTLIFPGSAQIGHRDPLPARGNMLRHTYRTVAADLGVDDLIIHFLLGHAPEGISQKYIAKLVLSNGPKMREEQDRMSRRMVELLGLNAGTFRQEIAAALRRSLKAREGQMLARGKALTRAQRASALARRGKRRSASEDG